MNMLFTRRTAVFLLLALACSILLFRPDALARQDPGAADHEHASHQSDAQQAGSSTDHAHHGQVLAAAQATPAATATLALPDAPAALYVCPMHPQIRSAEPGRCPICGMQLVARGKQSTAEDAPEIVVDGSLRQSLGLRSEAVERRVLEPLVEAPAQVMIDQDRIVHLHARVAGWIEVLHVHALGETVNAGQVLMELYAPDLVAAQEDYLIALRTGGSGSRAQRAAATRLRVLGVDDAFIDALAKRGSSLQRVPVRAPGAGVVTQLDVRHGMYVTPSTTMLEIADLSSVWVMAEIFPEERERLGTGEIFATLRLEGVPDRLWRGEVGYVYPTLDETTRTLRLRIPVPNRRGLLKLGHLMRASLRGEAGEPVLTVPSEAVIRSADGERVVLDLGDGRYRPVAVGTGLRAAGYTEIVEGLDAGQQVVVSAQFLLDSEASLRAGLGRLEAGVHEH